MRLSGRGRVPPPSKLIIGIYGRIVSQQHPDHVHRWPLLSGFDVKVGAHKGWTIYLLEHTGINAVMESTGVGELPDDVVGTSFIDDTNMEAVRRRLEAHFGLGPRDAVVFERGGIEPREFAYMMQKHEEAMGLGSMRVFLSHKGPDKPMVRRFKETLKLLGFDPWLDEDAMPAGTDLERGLLKGFDDSCAVVFFITPRFVDENYLATEVGYAVQQKRKKGDKFQIVTLLFDGAEDEHVPDLLGTYVYKRPQDELEALREILKALPIQVGPVHWRQL